MNEKYVEALEQYDMDILSVRKGRGSWISFGVYMGVGVVIWLWMVAIRWKKSGVIIETPDGEQQF